MLRTMKHPMLWACGVVLVAVAFTPRIRGTQDAADGLPPRVELTADEDRARLRELLGLPEPPPNASSSSPETFDRAAANPYPNLPDPLVLDSGQPVTSAEVWNTQRKPELLEHFAREIYGRTPDETPGVRWEVTERANAMNGPYPVVTKTLVGHVDNSSYPAIDVEIQASVSTPANATGPVPVIMAFGGQPGGRGRGAAGRGRGQASPEPNPNQAQFPSWQQQALALGWGYANVVPNSIQPDNGAGLTAGIIGLVNQGQPRDPDDWGSLAAWGWGASRMLDYFETDPAVDATQVGMYGHSRYGKATLLTIVLDERFAIGYVSSSGQGGAKLHRRKYGEIVENVASTFYHWMAGNYMKYAGHWDDMPVDSHELIALAAPRPVFFSGGNDVARNANGSVATRVDDEGRTVVASGNDAWVDPEGNFMAAVAAGPVYELLGKRGLGETAFPPVNTRIIGGDLGFHQHPGGHTSGPAWPTFFTFASRYLQVR
jgi:hypothetical protein